MISSKSSYLTIFAFVLLLPVNETLGQDGNVFRNSGIEVPSATDRPEGVIEVNAIFDGYSVNLSLYTSPSPRDATLSRMPSSA